MYAELHCKTNYSFLEGASHADELVAAARERGYAALAVTDRDSLAGVVRAYVAAKEHDFKLIIGAEVHPSDAPAVVLWATDRKAYGRLCRLLTAGRRRADKGECHLTFADIVEHAEGLIAGVIPDDEDPVFRPNGAVDNSPGREPWVASSPSMSPNGATLRAVSPRWGSSDVRGMSRTQGSAALHPGLLSVAPLGLETCDSRLHDYHDLFLDRAYLLAELFRGPDDAQRLYYLKHLSRRTRLPLVAANDVRYHTPARLPLHDVLTAIRHGNPVASAGDQLFPNAQRHLRRVEEILAAFADAPDAVARTLEIAGRCTFRLDELRYEYPEELVPANETPTSYLARLTWAGAADRYPAGVPDKVRQLVERELALIAELQYEAYFLTVHDVVRFARSKEILCQGRGSAANSAVCYCLGVTSVDPDRIDVLFERFVSRERDEPPDIDVDFEHERREEVIQYVYGKYGRDRAGLAATVITYRVRSAVRDVGKALGLSLDRVDALAKQVEGYHTETLLAERCAQVGIDPGSPLGARLLHLVNELLGFPRHLSQHVGGMVITRGPLCELVVIENAAMPDRTVVQWDKDDLEALGLLKVDVLGLGMLTAIRRCFAMVEQHYNRPLTLATVPAEDPAVYDMVCAADTVGVFQIESRGQMSMLPRLKPRCFYDLVIEVAILRPGPIQGNMVHPFLRRRHGEEPVTYASEALREVLHKTLGVPLFQEQVLRIAVVAAGFSGGEADRLRRAMASWGRAGVIEQFRDQFMTGMAANGYDAATAEELFSQLLGYGGYGFPESHAASFALLVYVSAWLKCYYPAAFTANLLNSQPMGFYAPSQLVQDAERHGVVVLPADVNESDYDCTLTGGAMRLGLRLVGGLRESAAAAIVASRGDVPFSSMSDVIRRTGLARHDLEALSNADAFGSLNLDRRSALWQSIARERKPSAMPLFDGVVDDEPAVGLPVMTPFEQVVADYRATGLSLKGHPMGFYRDDLTKLKAIPAEQLTTIPHGRSVTVGGIVIMRQRPSTAKGVTFVTLEDETGIANLVVHQSTWEKYYTIARRSPAWLAHGTLERKDAVIHVLIRRLEDLSAKLGELRMKSRDFR